MTAVRVVIKLPYILPLPVGEYMIGDNEAILLATTASNGRVRTRVSSRFDASNEIDQESADRIARHEAAVLVRRTNRFLRWYRQLASSSSILEVTRSQVSPFWFRKADAEPVPFPSEQEQIGRVLQRDPLWFSDADEEATPPSSRHAWIVPSLNFEAEKPIPPRFATITDLVAVLRDRLASASEPDVAQLNLLDARHAKSLGRFREAVLLSWSVVDSTFVQRFESLVDEKLAGEWGEARKFLKGLDFGLRHKMTSGLRLVASRSFFNEPNGFWERLSKSYDRRNKIIHEGSPADEDDADQPIAVAEKVLNIIDTL